MNTLFMIFIQTHSKLGARAQKYDVTITSNIENEMMTFRVKLSNFPDFGRKQDSCLNLRASFEAIDK